MTNTSATMNAKGTNAGGSSKARSLFVALAAAFLMGCVTIPPCHPSGTYPRCTNSEEIRKAEVSNNRWYWITVGAIAVVPY